MARPPGIGARAGGPASLPGLRNGSSRQQKFCLVPRASPRGLGRHSGDLRPLVRGTDANTPARPERRACGAEGAALGTSARVTAGEKREPPPASPCVPRGPGRRGGRAPSCGRLLAPGARLPRAAVAGSLRRSASVVLRAGGGRGTMVRGSAGLLLPGLIAARAAALAAVRIHYLGPVTGESEHVRSLNRVFTTSCCSVRIYFSTCQFAGSDCKQL